MATANTKQINFIKTLLADKQHTDSGKTILVGKTRFRTTADKIDEISSSVASRLINALKDAPMKPAEERTPERPHFRYLIRGWVIAGVEDGQPGDIVEVTTKAGETRSVRLTWKDGIMWRFEDAPAEEVKEAEEDEQEQEGAPAETEEQVTYTSPEDASFHIITRDGAPYLATTHLIDTRIDHTHTPVTATRADGETITAYITTVSLPLLQDGTRYYTYGFTTTRPGRNRWEQQAYSIGRSHGIDGGIWDHA